MKKENWLQLVTHIVRNPIVTRDDVDKINDRNLRNFAASHMGSCLFPVVVGGVLERHGRLVRACMIEDELAASKGVRPETEFGPRKEPGLALKARERNLLEAAEDLGTSLMIVRKWGDLF